MILTPLQKLPKNVENLGELIVAKGLKKLLKVKKKSPNLVTLQRILIYFVVSLCFGLIANIYVAMQLNPKHANWRYFTF